MDDGSKRDAGLYGDQGEDTDPGAEGPEAEALQVEPPQAKPPQAKPPQAKPKAAKEVPADPDPVGEDVAGEEADGEEVDGEEAYDDGPSKSRRRRGGIAGLELSAEKKALLLSIYKRAFAILIKPADEWKKIGAETWTTKDLFTRYVLVLAAIPAVAGFLGNVLIGYSKLGYTVRYPIGNAITWAVLMYGAALGITFGLAAIMDLLAPTFGAKKDMPTSLKVVVFSSTASWVGGIFSLIPTLGPLGLVAGGYGLYLMFLGMKAIRNVKEDKFIGYFVAMVVATVVLTLVAFIIIGAVALPNLAAPVAEVGVRALTPLR